jgi:hypothetical protein
MNRKASPEAEKAKPKNTFTVDGTNPTVPEGASLEQVRRAMKIEVIDGSQQEGVVVKTLGKVNTEKLPIEPQEATVVKKIGEKISTPAVSNEGRVKNSKPRKGLEAYKKVEVAVEEPKIEAPAKKEKVKKAAPKKDSVATSSDKDYLSMLPDDWSKMHWTNMEKFIKGLTDVNFIKFIKQVEPKAIIQKTCDARLKELNG